MSSTMSSLKACRMPNSNMIVLPNARSRPKKSFVFVNARSLFTEDARSPNDGVWTWWAYDSRKPVRSVTGKETRIDGARMPRGWAVK